jgi:hypothetical protein
MTTIIMFFITIFILLQCLLGLGLLYRGYTLVLDHYGLGSWKNIIVVVSEQFRLVASVVTWRRAAVLFSLLVPGSIPILLVVAGWRYLRQSERGAIWRVGTRRLKTAIENIAL